MNPEIVAIYIPVIGILVGGAIAIIAIVSDNKQKQEMIKNGIPIPEKRRRNVGGYSSLKFGALAIGVALGMIVGGFIENAEIFNDEETGFFASVFLFGGIALVLVSLYINKQMNNKNS